MKTLPCEFKDGKCVHCGDTTRGECEGWTPPDPGLAELKRELVAWRAQFKAYVYRAKDDCVALRGRP